jgi:hypothetical protein
VRHGSDVFAETVCRLEPLTKGGRPWSEITDVYFDLAQPSRRCTMRAGADGSHHAAAEHGAELGTEDGAVRGIAQ